MRTYEAVIHGQLVMVTVVEPGIAKGANFQRNLRCKSLRYGRDDDYYVTESPREWRKRPHSKKHRRHDSAGAKSST